MSAPRATPVAWLLGFLLTMGSITSALAADTPIGETAVGGKVFLDASHLGQYKNGKRTDVSRNGIDLTRFYVDIDHVSAESGRRT